MSENKKRKPILKYFFSFILCIILGFLIYRIPYVSYLINSTSSSSNSNSFSNKNEKSLDEVIFSPYIIDGKTNSNYIDFKKCDLSLGIFENSATSTNLKDLSFTPSVIAKGNRILNNYDSKLMLYKNHFSETSINGHSICFLYLDNDLENANDISSYTNIIKDLKKNNSFLILYIEPSVTISKEALEFLSKCGVNIVFSPHINNIYVEKIQNSIIIYGVEKTSDFLPQFNIVFNDKVPVSLGLKFLVNPNTSSVDTLNTINSLSKNFNFNLSDKYNFIEY